MEKYLMIFQAYKKKINEGELKEGARLPSVKKTAGIFQCAPETVVKAYRELVQQHLVYVKPQSGHYVAKSGLPIEKISKSFNLRTGNIEIAKFPLFESQTNLLQGLDKYQHQTLNFNLNGVPSLLEALQKYLQDAHLFVEQERIFINQGVHQAFVAICESELVKNKGILMESPSYTYSLSYIQQNKKAVTYIKRTEKGFSMSELRERFKSGEIGLFFLTTRNHNPLGTSLPKKQIREIARLAEKYDILVIEDDYFSEGQMMNNYETIFENTLTHCVYLSSFTKVIPHLRMGFMILPQHMQNQWSKIIHNYYFTGYFAPSLIAQSALEVTIRNGSLSYYKKQNTAMIKQTRMQMKACASQWNDEILRYVPGDSGYYGTIFLHPKLAVDTIIKELARKNIFVCSLRNNYPFIHAKAGHGLRISVSQIDCRDIPTVFSQIQQVCESRWARLSSFEE